MKSHSGNTVTFMANDQPIGEIAESTDAHLINSDRDDVSTVFSNYEATVTGTFTPESKRQLRYWRHEARGIDLDRLEILCHNEYVHRRQFQ